MIPNILRKIIGRFWQVAWQPFWNLYYGYGSLCPPKKHYYDEWIKDPETGEYDYLHYGDFYDPVCFPLPFKINCVGCHGCGSNLNPLLSPDKYKGSWKIMFADTFKDEYKRLFGEPALIDLLYKTELHNEECDSVERK